MTSPRSAKALTLWDFEELEKCEAEVAGVSWRRTEVWGAPLRPELPARRAEDASSSATCSGNFFDFDFESLEVTHASSSQAASRDATMDALMAEAVSGPFFDFEALEPEVDKEAEEEVPEPAVDEATTEAEEERQLPEEGTSAIEPFPVDPEAQEEGVEVPTQEEPATEAEEELQAAEEENVTAVESFHGDLEAEEDLQLPEEDGMADTTPVDLEELAAMDWEPPVEEEPEAEKDEEEEPVAEKGEAEPEAEEEEEMLSEDVSRADRWVMAADGFLDVLDKEECRKSRWDAVEPAAERPVFTGASSSMESALEETATVSPFGALETLEEPGCTKSPRAAPAAPGLVAPLPTLLPRPHGVPSRETKASQEKARESWRDFLTAEVELRSPPSLRKAPANQWCSCSFSWASSLLQSFAPRAARAARQR